MKRLLKILLVVIFFLSFSCVFLYYKGYFDDYVDVSDNSVVKVDDSEATEKGVKAVIDANNQFAFDLFNLYQSDVNKANDNLFFSPYSISTALAMTYEGAKGKTAEEMQNVFGFPKDSKVRNPAYAKLYNIINGKNKSYKLSTANALWAQKDYKFLDEYFNTVDKYYGGKVTNLDFIGDRENSRITINTWVEKQTEDKIKDLIGVKDLTSDTKLVLTNAIYFKGDWITQFDKERTSKAPFYVSKNEILDVDMMEQTGEETKFNYYEDTKYQILELPYSGNDLSMIVVLPKVKGANVNLTQDRLGTYISNLKETNVDVYLPKFKFETKNYMKPILSAMGMTTAFSAGADFSGMTGSKDLMIDDVIHQAFIDVNEEGTEAAAATAVAMVRLSAPIKPVFNANHPFVFIIQQKDTGNILFMGKVQNPSL